MKIKQLMINCLANTCFHQVYEQLLGLAGSASWRKKFFSHGKMGFSHGKNGVAKIVFACKNSF